MGAVVSNVYLSLTVVDDEDRALEIVTPWQGENVFIMLWRSTLILFGTAGNCDWCPRVFVILWDPTISSACIFRSRTVSYNVQCLIA
jgi:hypothetical protein